PGRPASAGARAVLDGAAGGAREGEEGSQTQDQVRLSHEGLLEDADRIWIARRLDRHRGSAPWNREPWRAAMSKPFPRRRTSGERVEEGLVQERARRGSDLTLH